MTWEQVAYWAGMVLGAFVVPALAVRGLLRATEGSAATVENYRGRKVAPVLGAAWLVWVLAIGAFSIVQVTVLAGPIAANLAISAVLVIGVFALGLLDDAYGDRSRSGLRGHLEALRGGLLTTGALKMAGIALLAATASLWIVVTQSGVTDRGQAVLSWLAATLVIGGSANLVNLADLRPLRALKTYLLLAAIAVFLGAAGRAADPEGATTSGIATLVVLFGPALAVWSPDARERGMLGDAGANAAGVLAGYWLAFSLVALPVGLAVAAAFIVALNLVSERISFSEVIEGNRALKWLDVLGRPKE